jgi:hypothetical protein
MVDADLFAALTLLVAVSEQVLLELERGEPGIESELSESVSAARTAALRTLTSKRFADPPPGRAQ